MKTIRVAAAMVFYVLSPQDSSDTDQNRVIKIPFCSKMLFRLGILKTAFWATIAVFAPIGATIITN